MRQRTSTRTISTDTKRRPRVVIEDSAVDLASVDFAAAAPLGWDIGICSGPSSPGEPCPLVLDGVCPLGTPDVVVCALGPPWRASVEAAWVQAGVPVAAFDPAIPLEWPAHLGAALATAYPSEEEAP